ncbi:hypothetical protein KAJ89_03390 [Candidatus Parcubacteria bacterium]|nr:hypothetical protein [Candidatus Parcubacteria bacterium]MCK5211720.1 hypothetical protein [Candidatus Parcubacteria bacterium]
MSYLILIIGLLINIKIYYWITISRKGFKSETPEGFLRHSNLYAIVDIIFFILAIIFSRVPWYLILIAYFLSFIPAGMLAEKKFNKIVKELKEEEIK